MKSNRKSYFLFWNNVYNWKNNCNNSDILVRWNNSIWAELFGHSALQTALAASPMSQKLVATHRIGVHRKAVPRTHLQRPKSWSAKTNNVYNRKNNAYNSTGTLPQVAFYSVYVPFGQCRWAGILHRHCRVIPPCLGQELLSARCHFPDASTLS